MACHPPSSETIERAVTLAAANRDESIERLSELIKIRSLTGEEGDAQEYMAKRLREISAEVHVVEPDVPAMFEAFPNIAQYPTHWQHDLILPYEQLPTYEALRDSGLESVLNYRGRPNVVGVVRGTGGGRSLILNGHIDTVTVEPANEWRRDPFGGVIEDGRMYGRGTTDMKGGLMAGVMALTFLHRAGVRLAGDVILQSVVNEEHAGNGTLDLVRQGWQADAAVVLDGTDNRIAVSHPGGLYWQVTIPGVVRPPGARWEADHLAGVSAIEKLPHIVDALLELERAYHARAVDHPHERGRAPMTLVIGKVEGGHYETATAGEVVLRGCAYFSPKAGDILTVMQGFRDCIAVANVGDEFLSRHPAKLHFLHHDDATDQDPDIEIARHAAAVLERRGANGAVRPGPSACDMRHLVNQGGIPSIIFAPGCFGQAHKIDEYIELDTYTACIEHLIEMIVSWCNLEAETAPIAADEEANCG